MTKLVVAFLQFSQRAQNCSVQPTVLHTHTTATVSWKFCFVFLNCNIYNTAQKMSCQVHQYDIHNIELLFLYYQQKQWIGNRLNTILMNAQSEIGAHNKLICMRDCYRRCTVNALHTCFTLDGPGIESRWEARFSAPVQTGSGGHPASCTMGTGSFPGVKAARAWRWPLTPSSAEVMKE
jgi:hypothetical protein